MGTAYPSDLPVNEIQSIVATIRSGKIADNRKEFAKDLWVVEGYILNQVVGDVPAMMATPVVALRELDDCEAADALMGLVSKASLPSTIVENIPWRELAKWAAKMLLTFL